MADGLDNLIGEKTSTLSVGGKDYTVSTALMADHAEKESYINGLRPGLAELLSQIPDRIPAKVMQGLQETAFKVSLRPQFVTQDEEDEFDESRHGFAWRVWRSLRDHHTEFGKGGDQIYQAPNERWYSMTPAEGVQAVLSFMEFAQDFELAAIRQRVDEAEEKDIIPNSSGSVETDQNHHRAPIDESPGQESSDSLAGTMDGQTATSGG